MYVPHAQVTIIPCARPHASWQDGMSLLQQLQATNTSRAAWGSAGSAQCSTQLSLVKQSCGQLAMDGCALDYTCIAYDTVCNSHMVQHILL